MDTGKKAAIHDLGYQRYSGTRRAQRTRYQVIVRNQMATAWKGWWVYKLPLLISLTTAVGIAVAMYVSRQKIIPSERASSMMRTVADSLIPQSFSYLSNASLLVCLTVLSGVIARDLKAGAFEFFFSRPVRPIDYVAGRLGGAFALLAPILIIAPVLLTVYRLGLTGEVEQISNTLPWIPKALLVGICATIVQASVSLAFGAITQSPKYAIAGYAAFVIIYSNIISGLARSTGTPDLAALDIRAAISGLASALFDVNFLFSVQAPGLIVSCLSLAGYTILSIAIIVWRVRKAQRAGMGGG